MIRASDFKVSLHTVEKQVEERIDEAITNQKKWVSWGSTVTINVSKLGGSHSIVESVLAKYRANGWRAEIVYDQRDGDFVKMEPK